MAGKPEPSNTQQQPPRPEHVIISGAGEIDVPLDDPPSYSGLYEGPPPLYYSGELPPAYQVAASLPTYEEAEMSKGKTLYDVIHSKYICSTV
jgi:hypothetical protein